MTLQEYFLEQQTRSTMWDPKRNGSVTPQMLTTGSKSKVWWLCEQGHSWQAAVFSVVLEGCGCPYCAGRRAIPGENDLVTMRPDLMKQWDYEKNASLNPQMVLPSQHVKVWWRCERGHSWQAAIYSRTRENGCRCPYCTGKKVLTGFNDLATVKPELAKEWYQPMNGSLKPTDVTPGSNKKVWWQCDERHVWQAAVYARTKKYGTSCPVCAGRAKRSHVMGMEVHTLSVRPESAESSTIADTKSGNNLKTRREAV